jgi:hypothetical protein
MTVFGAEDGGGAFLDRVTASRAGVALERYIEVGMVVFVTGVVVVVVGGGAGVVIVNGGMGERLLWR